MGHKLPSIFHPRIHGKAILPVLVALAGSVLAQDAPLLTYHWRGWALPADTQVHVTIQHAGQATVEFEKKDLPPANYETSLSQTELESLTDLIRAIKFFDLPVADQEFGARGGETELTIHLDRRTRSLAFRQRPELDRLVLRIQRLITQASAIRAVESGDVYTALLAADPRLAGLKALQPSALKAPLMAHARKPTSHNKLTTALRALAWIMSPEELHQFISTEMEAKQQRDPFLSVIGHFHFYGNIPKLHVQALCPVYLSFLQDAWSRNTSLNPVEKDVQYSIITILKNVRYEPAVPFWIQCFEAHQEPHVTPYLVPLATLGLGSLNALIPYLDHTNENYRANAIALLTIASRSAPHAGFFAPLSAAEFNSMIPVFTNTVIPRCRELVENDPSEIVRSKATEALQEIPERLEKEVASIEKAP